MRADTSLRQITAHQTVVRKESGVCSNRALISSIESSVCNQQLILQKSVGAHM